MLVHSDNQIWKENWWGKCAPDDEFNTLVTFLKEWVGKLLWKRDEEEENREKWYNNIPLGAEGRGTWRGGVKKCLPSSVCNRGS